MFFHLGFTKLLTAVLLHDVEDVGVLQLRQRPQEGLTGRSWCRDYAQDAPSGRARGVNHG